MSEELSQKFHGHWLEASTKFDYFVTGLALALVGYLGAELEITVATIGLSEGLEIGATLLLLASGGLGLKRIETMVTFLHASSHQFWAEEQSRLYREGSKPGVIAQTETGKVLGPAAAADRSQTLKEAADKLTGDVDALRRKATRLYQWRSRLLVLGLLVLIVARVLVGV